MNLNGRRSFDQLQGSDELQIRKYTDCVQSKEIPELIERLIKVRNLL